MHGAPNAQTPVDNAASERERLVTLWMATQASSMNAAALSEALSESLAPWEKVRRIAVVDELPTTATGKPDPLAAAEIVTASER